MGKKKFESPLQTAKGEERAWVSFKELRTLWFNTGTLCNLSCDNCYIESSPHNDRLAYITGEDVAPYLEEIRQRQLPTREIAFTGGEPFLNPHMLDILDLCLQRGFEVLVLTNAYRAINHPKRQRLVQLEQNFPGKLTLRVSLDHYTRELHERERGEGTFEATLQCMAELHALGLKLVLASRMLQEEDEQRVRHGHRQLLEQWNIPLDCDDPQALVIFPEMDEGHDVPEITTACWEILGKNPDHVMCSSSRMVVKRKGEQRAVVVACTLLPYDPQFQLGTSLRESERDIRLNHPFCAQFCVLGGASCSV